MKEKEIRIIFYGTPEIAAYQLKWLIEQGYNVVAAVTQSDKPSGRGQKMASPEVKIVAQQHHIPVFQPLKLKDPEFQKQIEDLQPDMQVVVAYRMMPECIYSIPKYGTFNLHTSLLPQYRGAAPINRAIMNGEKQSGLTTFLLNEKTDCGKIILQQKIEIGEKMTAGELHDTMMQQAPDLIKNTIAVLLSDNPVLEEQTIENEEQLRPAPKIFKPDMLIDWHWNGEKILSHIRGLCPYPAAFAEFEDRETNKIHHLKVFFADFEKKNIDPSSVGEMRIEDKDKIEVNCNDGVIKLLDIQISGKKRMKAEEFLRGFRIRHPLYSK